MRHTIATVCLAGTLPEKLNAIAAANFDGFELFEQDLINYPGSPRELRALAASLNLSIDLYQPFRDFEGVSADQLTANLRRAALKFELMNDLGVGLMLVCSNASASALPGDELAAEQLRALAELAARYEVKIAFEALSWGTHINRTRHAWEVVQKVDHPHLGLCLDSFHMLAVGEPPSVLDGIPGHRIAFVQIADAPRMRLDALSWSRHYRSFPGQGDFDLAEFTGRLLATGYSGSLSLEVFNDEFRSASPRRVAKDGRRSLLFLEEQVRASRTSAPAPDAPRRPVALFDPPPPPAFEGVSFVEFSADAGGADRLGRWLTQAGFTRLGAHKSKAVTLYRQDQVNLVVNAEPDSFAHAYFLLHGVAVCALGVRTQDADQAFGRAIAYGEPRFQGRIGPQEFDIPAIRAPDGSLVYYVDRRLEAAGLYEIEFGAEPAPAGGQLAAPQGVDHVAIALPDDQLDHWVLFYRSSLGLGAEGLVDVPDPYGLVRSRPVTDAGRTLRIPLNVSNAARTTTARQVADHVGPSVQHIALACPDLFATVAALRRSGAPILQIPANYYDDLDARFGLPADLLDRMRSLNVLFDRNAQGEFLQAYTEPFEGRFFLEFVQRIGGYQGYGAPNAAVRIAAQREAMGAFESRWPG